MGRPRQLRTCFRRPDVTKAGDPYIGVVLCRSAAAAASAAASGRCPGEPRAARQCASARGAAHAGLGPQALAGHLPRSYAGVGAPEAARGVQYALALRPHVVPCHCALALSSLPAYCSLGHISHPHLLALSACEGRSGNTFVCQQDRHHNCGIRHLLL